MLSIKPHSTPGAPRFDSIFDQSIEIGPDPHQTRATWLGVVASEREHLRRRREAGCGPKTHRQHHTCTTIDHCCCSDRGAIQGSQPARCARHVGPVQIQQARRRRCWSSFMMVVVDVQRQLQAATTPLDPPRCGAGTAGASRCLPWAGSGVCVMRRGWPRLGRSIDRFGGATSHRRPRHRSDEQKTEEASSTCRSPTCHAPRPTDSIDFPPTPTHTTDASDRHRQQRRRNSQSHQYHYHSSRRGCCVAGP